MISFLKYQWFIIVLIVLLLFGMTFPGIGAAIGFGGITTTTLVILIFLLSGFTLPTEAVTRGLSSWRLHIYIQTFIFVITPLYYVTTFTLLSSYIPQEYQLGIYALACLPTTISSCIIFTQLSGGNVVGTMVNAILANVAGIVVSPLLFSFLIDRVGGSVAMVGTGRIFFSLGYKMILPLIVGQSFRRFARAFATSYKKQFSIVANIAILLIVFISFSVSATDPLFRKTLVDSKRLYLYLALSFLILLTLAYFAARLLRFSREDLVSVVFTAPQKTLAMGVPLLTTIFAENPAVLGLAMLPILIYHPWQLIVSGVVKNMRFLKIE